MKSTIAMFSKKGTAYKAIVHVDKDPSCDNAQIFMGDAHIETITKHDGRTIYDEALDYLCNLVLEEDMVEND